MKPARAISVVLVVITITSMTWGEDVSIGDTSPIPDFEFPDFDPGNSFFQPNGVIQGMILGDILQRIQNLEAFCEVDGEKFQKLPDTSVPSGFAPGPRQEEQDVNTKEEPGLEFPPDFFDSDDFSLTSKVEEVEATLQLLRESMQESKREQGGFRGDLEVVKEQVASVQKQMTETQQDIAHTKEELMAAIAETNEVLTTQNKDIGKLQKSASFVSSGLADLRHNLSHLDRLEMSVRQAVNSYGKTSRHVDLLVRNVTSLQTDVDDMQAALNRSTGGEKVDHKSNVTDRLIARLSKQMLGIKKRLKKGESAKCESGRVMFMNYPFSYGNWPQKREIHFSRPFARRPVITLGITQLDVSYKYNTRAGVRLVKRSNVGFTLSCDGWYNTRLYRVEVTWMACLV
ncbi:uncharacterized protein LOC121371964 [Gigantopelta aegis]|uniref:uncharacterized protein LOC121371964 n=1 Tax=Gigantopelta aegis TaxID=1735272 RepID=UPI001B889918|nr:uncharacterized protein LOC121371964 [Gigantopelta aegis]